VVERTAEPGPAVDGRADGGSPEAGEGTVSAPQPPGFRWVAAACAGVLTAVVIGVPTDIIANSWFTREIPVRMWEYPVLAATCVLTAAWFGIRTARPDTRQGGAGAFGGAGLAMFAVGCPVCNKLVLAAVGTSGALGVWAPIQPYLAAVSLGLLATAVVYRWRRRDCGPECAVPRGA